MASAASQSPIMPISELSSYLGRWTIKAKVVSKAPIRTFKKGTGEGSVFHVEITDAQGGEIRASFFNDAATKFNDILMVGKVYSFSKGSVKVANKQYNSTNHKYEITFERDAQIAEDSADIGEIAVKFNFTDLREVQKKALPCRVDLCGIVTEFRPIQTVNAKDGRELIKRDITIADDTATSMEVTLWGDKGKLPDADFEGNPVIAVKAIYMKEWNGGRSGSTIDSSLVSLKPSLPEATRLQQWWSGGGSAQSLVSLKGAKGAGGMASLEHLTVSQMRRRAEQVGEQAESYRVTARLSLVQTRKQGEQVSLHYLACAEMKEGKFGSLPCNRRVDGSGFCAACNVAGKTAMKLNTRCRFADFGDGCWLGTFHEGAQEVIGMTADKLAEMDGGADGRERLEAVIRQRCFLEPMELKVRARLETYQGEARANVSCVGAGPVNRREHGRKMLSEIQQMLSS